MFYKHIVLLLSMSMTVILVMLPQLIKPTFIFKLMEVPLHFASFGLVAFEETSEALEI